MFHLDNYTGLYFYSTVFQGNMALLAFAGVFVVFKLQILSHALQLKEEQINSLVAQSCSQVGVVLPDFLRDMLRDLDTFHDKFSQKLKDESYRPSIKPDLQRICDNPVLLSYLSDRWAIIHSRETLIKEMIAPFLAIVLVVLVSLILLPLASVLHTNTHDIELYAIFGTMLCNVLAITMNVKFVIKVLRQ